jgi:hypothetical protein
VKFLLLAFVLIGFIGFADGQTPDKLTIFMGIDEGKEIINGIVKDQNGNTVEGVTVQITTILETSVVTTNNDGEFSYKLPETPSDGRFSISVKAQKDGYLAGYANTSFYINSINNIEKHAPQEYGFKVVTSDKLKNDPVAVKILEQIEQNKKREEERQQKLRAIEEQQNFIAKQREISNQTLLNDLQSWLDQFDPFKPRNAFSTFVSQIDMAVQNIYWGQFNFTESKTNEGLAAMQQVLKNNGTQEEARQAFYEKAAIKQSDMDRVNNELNRKYAKNNTAETTRTE